MQRLPVIVGLVTLCLAMLVGAGATQDAKKDKDEKKDTGKFKPYTPPGFKALMLTKEQKDKIYSIQKDYHAKIAELQNKLNELKDQRSQEEFKVLTAEQRDKYLKSKGVDTKKDGDKDKGAKESKVDAARVQVHSLSVICDSYRIKNKSFPVILAALLEKDPNGVVFVVDPNSLKDPWGKVYQYDPSGPKNKGRHADIWTVSPDNIKIGNWPK